jgi:site-specific DNA-adenine methylase
MGSKRKLAEPIIDYILENNPNCKYFYDLFGGGGAMSFKALQRPQIEKVYYNELNTGVCELLKKIQNEGVKDENFFKWVDRETFHKHKNDKDWYGGFIATCWSFGNNKDKGYMFSKENEKLKKPLHIAIIEKDAKYLKDFYDITGIELNPDCLNFDTVQERRLNLMRDVKSKCNQRIDLQRLEQLEQLQQLQRLERLERLEISNLSYEDVIINTPENETVIYLDPPYKGTEKYQHCIDYDKFYEYVNKSKYKIYISSYNAPFNLVNSFEHRTKLSATANNKVIENLYCNKQEAK